LVVLDSWALLAVLKRETAAERVRSTWTTEGAAMSSIYADAFCVATAQRLDAPVLTGDPEIVALAGEVEVVDLRSA